MRGDPLVDKRLGAHAAAVSLKTALVTAAPLTKCEKISVGLTESFMTNDPNKKIVLLICGANSKHAPAFASKKLSYSMWSMFY